MDTQITVSGITLIVSLIVPGVIFKRFYYQGQFTKQFGVGLFADRLITSIFWGIFAQIITFLIYSRSFGFTFTSIRQRISSVYQDVAKNNLPNLTYQHLTYILGYLFFLVIISAALGSIFHQIIRTFKIDVKSGVFRFANQWHYYFTGEILATKDFRKEKKGKVLSTMVDVLIEDGSEKNKMVSGFLKQYTISPKTGDLESIYLTNVARYSQTSAGFKEVPGDLMIIPYNRVIDMNLRYNVRVVDTSKKKALIGGLVSMFGFIELIFCFLAPWFASTTFLNKAIGFLFSATSGLLLIAIIYNPFQPKNKLTRKELWFSVVTFLICGLIALSTLEIIHFSIVCRRFINLLH